MESQVFFQQVLTQSEKARIVHWPHAWGARESQKMDFREPDRADDIALNEIVWRNFDTSTWVNFKVFGVTPITMAFAIAQMPLTKRYHLEPATLEAFEAVTAKKPSGSGSTPKGGRATKGGSALA